MLNAKRQRELAYIVQIDSIESIFKDTESEI